MATDAPLLYYGLPLAYALSAAVTLGLTAYLLAVHGRKPTARGLAAVGGFLVIWTVGMGGRLLSTELPSTLFWNAFAYVGIVGTAVAWFAFALRYTGRDRYLRLPILGLVSVPGAFLIALVSTSASHTLYYTDMRLLERWGHTVLYTDETLLFYAFAGWHYLLFVIGAALIVGFVVTSHRTYRIHGAVLASGAVIPLVVNVLYVTDVLGTGFDPTPFAFGVSVLLVAAAVLDASFLDVLPVARTHVVEGLAEAIIVLDEADRVVDFNRHATTYLDGAASVVGRPVAAHLIEPLAESSVVQGTAPPGEPVEVALDGRWCRLSRQPLTVGADGVTLLVIADATDAKRREQQLEAHNRRLEEFATTLTHDLRNPLAVAMGRLELARLDQDDDEDLAAVAEALERIDRIIGTMLALAREGVTIRDPAPVDLPGLVESAWANVETGSASLTLELAAAEPLLADGDRLLQVFENLFRNALDQGSSRVTVGLLPDGAGIFVEDDGPGFPDDAIERVFDDGFSTSMDGTGLGLRIVAEIAAAHGWGVAATAGGDGGARLEFTGLEFVADGPASTDSREDRRTGRDAW